MKKTIWRRAVKPVEAKKTDETHFFGRHLEAMEFLGKKIIPKILKKNEKIVVNDIGCGGADWLGTGSGISPMEPYEIANQLEKNRAKYEIYATDISAEAIKNARAATSHQIRLDVLKAWEEKDRLPKRMSLWLHKRRFKKYNNIVISTNKDSKKTVKYVKDFFPDNQRITSTHFVTKIPETVKRKIRFEQADIVTSSPAKKADIVLFTNVLQHLPQEEARVAFTNVVLSVKKGGYLVLDAYSYPRTINLLKSGLIVVKKFGPGRVLVKKFAERPPKKIFDSL